MKELKSDRVKIFDKAMKEILLNNLSALSKGKADIKHFSKKEDKEIMEEMKKFLEILKNRINDLIKKEKQLRNKLNILERNKFVIYISLIILQSIALILNEGL